MLSLIVSLVVPSGTASAASDYDNIIQQVDDVVVRNYGASSGTTVTPNWLRPLTDACPSQTSTLSTDMENEDFKFLIFQNGNYMSLIWTTEPAASQGFRMLYGTPIFGFTGSYILKGVSLMSTGGNLYCPNVDYFSSTTWVTQGPLALWVSTFPITYPVGYEGEQIRSRFVPSYVAMGDSYTSGEGNPPFEYGTDVSNVNGCHRSSLAYPRLLQNDPDLEFGPTAFVACSGATTASIVGTGQWNESPQADALTDETEIVTLTIGGNDIGFSDYVLGCTVACGPGTPIYTAMMNGINQPAFKTNLIYTFEEILDAAPNADVYVADYPYLADENATICQGLDFSGAYDVQVALNGVILDAVMEVGLESNRIFMVQTNYPGSPFEGGHLCNGGSSLFNGVVAPPNVEYSLHPNVAGQAAYAEVFEEYIG